MIIYKGYINDLINLIKSLEKEYIVEKRNEDVLIITFNQGIQFDYPNLKNFYFVISKKDGVYEIRIKENNVLLYQLVFLILLLIFTIYYTHFNLFSILILNVLSIIFLLKVFFIRRKAKQKFLDILVKNN